MYIEAVFPEAFLIKRAMDDDGAGSLVFVKLAELDVGRKLLERCSYIGFFILHRCSEMVFKKFFQLRLLTAVGFAIIHAFTISEVYVEDYTAVYFQGKTMGILILTE